ncbi:MAG: hypothetical protein ACJ79R_04875 [Anaeromyxobacteraceae bacterium]
MILWRPGPRGTEIFWVLRSTKLGFAGGFRAFAGGRLDPADREVPVAGLTGDGPQVFSKVQGEIVRIAT